MLICIGACESAANAPLVSELVNYHLALASPLADLAEIAESLLKLAARLPHQAGPIVYDPFRPLFEACLEMRYSLNRGSTTIPSQALEHCECSFLVWKNWLLEPKGGSICGFANGSRRLTMDRHWETM